MINTNKKLEKLFAKPSDTIQKVLDQMDNVKLKEPRLPPGVVLVVGKEKKLLGIATNGDIRRAFASGAKVSDSISKAMNKNPSFIENPKNQAEILPAVFRKIREGGWHKDRLDKIIITDGNRKVLNVISFYDLISTTDIKFKNIGIVGLGYVGLTLGLTLADLGFRVNGFDVNKNILDSLRKGRPTFFENGIDSILKDNFGKNFKVVNNFKAENNCDIYFIAVGTPLDKNNKPILKYLENACKNLGKILKHGDAVILRSTVPVGTTRNIVVPVLEKTSGMKAGDDFLVSFAPERTIEGRALVELRKLPQIIGGINRASCDLVASIFNVLSNSVVLTDSLEAAEMVKLINNTYRDVTFAFANEVALVAQRWGIDSKKVIEAANFWYERSSVPFPSPGVGGYCLEKDPFIFIESSREKGYEPQLAKYAREINQKMVDFVAENIFSFLKNHKENVKNPKIVTLGLAFKGRPATSDIRGSVALELIKKLQIAKLKNIHVFDPVVPKEDIVNCGVKHFKNLESGFKDADAIVVMNNHEFFESLNIRDLLKFSRNPVLLLDGWSLYDPKEMSKVKNLHYKRI